LSVGLEELFIILTVSCLASSTISIARDCTALSTPIEHSEHGESLKRSIKFFFGYFIFSSVGACVI
jgi:hypothetical protein